MRRAKRVSHGLAFRQSVLLHCCPSKATQPAAARDRFSCLLTEDLTPSD